MALSRHWILYIQFYTQLASYTLGNPQITSLSTLPHQCLFQVAELSGTFEDSPRHVLLHLLQSSTAIGHTGTRHCTGCTQLTGNRELVEVGRGRVGVEALVSLVTVVRRCREQAAGAGCREQPGEGGLALSGLQPGLPDCSGARLCQEPGRHRCLAATAAGTDTYFPNLLYTTLHAR